MSLSVLRVQNSYRNLLGYSSKFTVGYVLPFKNSLCVCVSACMHAYHMYEAQGGSDSLEHEGAGNQTWVPRRISQLFLAAISLSPKMAFLEFPYVA